MGAQLSNPGLARQTWGQTVQLFASTVRMDKKLSNEDRSALLALLLHETERVADAALAGKKATADKGEAKPVGKKPDSPK